MPRRLTTRIVKLLVIGATLAACGVDLDTRGQPLSALKVAALQYDSYQFDEIGSCGDTQCAVKALIAQAASAGAVLVVAPELGLDGSEPDPAIGSLPATSSLPADANIKVFSQQALELQLQIVIHLKTYDEQHHYTTQVAFGPDGRIVGKHHKFELYGGEAAQYKPGTDVMVFDSPLGKIGLLICADIYGDLRLHAKLVEQLGARVIAFSSFWTVGGGHHWQANFAKNWGVYVVGSNTTYGSGRGGGIFDPQGSALAVHTEAAPALTIAEIPAP